jgi:hypothetical protein
MFNLEVLGSFPVVIFHNINVVNKNKCCLWKVRTFGYKCHLLTYFLAVTVAVIFALILLIFRLFTATSSRVKN